MADKFIWLEFLACTIDVRLDKVLFESYGQQLRENLKITLNYAKHINLDFSEKGVTLI
jgi:hypothetical protein